MTLEIKSYSKHTRIQVTFAGRDFAGKREERRKEKEKREREEKEKEHVTKKPLNPQPRVDSRSRRGMRAAFLSLLTKARHE